MNEINRFYLKYGKFLIRFCFRFRERAISRCCFYITFIFFAYQIYQIWFFKKFHSDQDITKIYRNDLIIKLNFHIYLVVTEANRSLPTVMTGQAQKIMKNPVMIGCLLGFQRQLIERPRVRIPRTAEYLKDYSCIGFYGSYQIRIIMLKNHS